MGEENRGSECLPRGFGISDAIPVRGVFFSVHPATEQDCHEVAKVLRPIDKLECYAWGADPVNALLYSTEASADAVYTVRANGRPIAMFGAGPLGISDEFGRVGSIWLLASDELFKNKLAFLRISKPWVRHVCAPYDRVENMVMSSNSEAITWLKHLGFTISETKMFFPNTLISARQFWASTADLNLGNSRGEVKPTNQEAQTNGSVNRSGIHHAI